MQFTVQTTKNSERDNLSAIKKLAVCNNLIKRLPTANLVYRDFRAGDVRHSLADISKGKEFLGYHPGHHIGEGLEEALVRYVDESLARDS